MTEPTFDGWPTLSQQLADAEADFIAAARRVDRLRRTLGMRPLGLEDLPPGEDRRREGEGEGGAKDEGGGEASAHVEPPSRCRSCGAPVRWTVTAKGKRMPVDPDGTSHFATCPQADGWRR